MTLPGERVRIELGPRSYDIVIGRGLLGRPESFEGLEPASHAAVVSNATVAPLFADALMAVLATRYGSVQLITLADGEAHKNWSSLAAIFDALLGSACDRSTTLFALGGGVVGDITGFAAACYMRGVPHVQVPTTLLAQVDSSVGGKTAINHPLGKNMIGAFHQPLRVVADIDTLRTLPQRELVAGLAEVIKCGVVADAGFLNWIEENLSALLARDEQALLHSISRCCQIKASVVAADEREAGLRAILNFGHTFGHAIEAGTGYGTWLHGEAVGCGMAMAADLSSRLGRIDKALARRIETVVAAAGLPTRAPAWGIERYLQLMGTDKKASGGEVRFVLLDAIGKARLAPADSAALAATISAFSG